jgi:hypothetical protein
MDLSTDSPLARAAAEIFHVIEPFSNFRIPLFVNAGRG